eukprot:g4898.t1 g4898   contig18:183027-185321(-)
MVMTSTARRRALPPSSLTLTLLQIVLCMVTFTHGFNSISSPIGTRNSIIPSTTSRYEPPSSPFLKARDSRSSRMRTYLSSSYNNERHSTSQGTLFPRKQQWQCLTKTHATPVPSVGRSFQLQMASDNINNDVSNNGSDSNNPLVKVWLHLRRLLAKMWCILMKPFQLLKVILTKTKSVTDKTTKEEEGPVQEDAVLTEMENLAVEEVVEPTVPEEEAVSSPQKTEVVATPAESKTVTSDITTQTSSDERQATAAVDLTGNWTLIVDDAFKSEYDEYLRRLGQPMLVRTVALTVIGSTKEETKQMEDGQKLFIRGTNVRGSWERTLEASETTTSAGDSAEEGGEVKHAVEGHELKPMITADDEEVEVASWWEDNGKVHKSWVVGGKKYGGGDFENKRYLSENGNILICESIFHPNEEGREKARVTWRFLREGAMYGDAAGMNIFEVFDKKEEETTSKKAKSDSSKPSRVVVGDIMDSVTTTDEASMMSTDTAIDVDEAMANWVPPSGKRWAVASPGIDLSGKWKLIITEQFKKDYDEFLKSLGQPLIVRGAAVVLIGNTREETKQSDNGRSLFIKGINAKGIWQRTLISSGSDSDTTLSPNSDGTYTHTRVPIVTADSEKVIAESWWENDGRVHVSWTIGVSKYGGGSFESKRYLENNGDVYVCESTFYPNDSKERDPSCLKWKFLREGATVYVGQ